MAKSNYLVYLAFFIVLFFLHEAMARIPINSKWHNANATFYGDINGGETMQGACGYGNLFDQGYGLETTALSTALFNNGYSCGACFEIRAGIVPVQYRRVPCRKSGGVKFQLSGNPYFLIVLIYNVADAGDILRVLVKGSKTDWAPMTHNWGQNWHTGLKLVGQDLSFWVTTSDRKAVKFLSIVPSYWQFGQTYQGSINF
ncbi:expansin-A25 protein [Medicago truncatula]|uniref:Expansin-A25 protein n=1 Tax=Medicago truncatula TaxID=3880 RepID=A0A072TK39_MEDTR|nr:expansin-A25 protein [Medicago truncatula]